MPGTWQHYDPNPADSVARGYVLAKSHAWGSDRDAVRALQGLAIESVGVQAWLAGGRISVGLDPSGQTNIQIDAMPGPNATPDMDHLHAAAALDGTWAALGKASGINMQLATGNDATLYTRAVPIETGFAWPVAVALIVVALAGAAATAYCAYQAAQVIDRKLSRDADTQKLIDTHATTLALLHAHAEQEQAAGKQLPLNDATRASLQSLLGQQETIVRKTDQPLSSGVPDSGLGGIGGGVLLAALAIGGVLLLSRS